MKGTALIKNVEKLVGLCGDDITLNVVMNHILRKYPSPDDLYYELENIDEYDILEIVEVEDYV